MLCVHCKHCCLVKYAGSNIPQINKILILSFCEGWKGTNILEMTMKYKAAEHGALIKMGQEKKQ